jgi:hypothetical protein
MAKLKKAPGRIIGRWKEEAIAANAGASDEDLAKIINDMARKQGYDDSKVQRRSVSAVWRQPQAPLPSHLIALHEQFLAKGALDVRY